MTTYSVTARLPDGNAVVLSPYNSAAAPLPGGSDDRDFSDLVESGPVRGFYVRELVSLGHSEQAAESAKFEGVALA